MLQKSTQGQRQTKCRRDRDLEAKRSTHDLDIVVLPQIQLEPRKCGSTGDIREDYHRRPIVVFLECA